jgi:hypothetical protein
MQVRAGRHLEDFQRHLWVSAKCQLYERMRRHVRAYTAILVYPKTANNNCTLHKIKSKQINFLVTY